MSKNSEKILIVVTMTNEDGVSPPIYVNRKTIPFMWNKTPATI